MENGQEAAIIPMGGDANSITVDKSNALPKKKKRAGPMNFFRVAMQLLRIKSGKSKSTQVQAASALRNVVGSMRPLHLQSHQDSPPRPIEPALPDPEPQPKPTEQVFAEPFEAYTPLMSPAQGGSSRASTSSSSASRYASANDLLQLCRKESELGEEGIDEESDEDDEDKYYDDKCGDEMIDSKADEFIARFYEQMRSQRNMYEAHGPNKMR